jgi:Alpha/beta hydrolase domain
MRTIGQRLCALLCLLVMLVAAGCADVARKSQSPAAVVESLKVDTRKPAFAGTTFGEVGAYEFVSGVATLRIDPAHPANSGIVDLLGAAGPDGLVRYRTDVAILRPVSPARALGTLVVEIANRGNKLALGRLADGATQFETAQQAGQGWFLRQGHTLAWIGWQGDVPLGKAGQSIGTDFPVVRNGSQPVTGLTEEEFIFDNTATRSRGTLTYPVAEGAKAGLPDRHPLS